MKFSIKQRASAAFTLVEVALAMGVASFCLVAVLGLVPLGIDTNRLASDQTACSGIITHVLADLRATPMTSPPGASATSTEYGLSIPSRSGPDAPTKPTVFKTLYFGSVGQQFSVVGSPTVARYRLTVTYLPTALPNTVTTSATSPDRTATGVVLLATWPPLVDPNLPSSGKPAGRVQVFANLDRN